MSKRSYFSLIVRYTSRDLWEIHFGDFEKSVVVQEMRDEKYHYPKAKFQVIETVEGQAAIDAVVAALNAHLISPVAD